MNIQNLDGYGSHLLILEALRQRTNYQRVLEFGGGEYSTPFFMGIPNASVTTVETQDHDWYLKIKEINPNTLWIPDHNEVLTFAKEYQANFDILFLDTHQDLRWKIATELQGRGMATVIHDSETESYDIHKIPNIDGRKFYYADFVTFRPWTGVITEYKELIEYLLFNHPGLIYNKMEEKVYLKNR